MDKPLRACAFPGCPELIRHKGYCRRHNDRPGHAEHYDKDWENASAAFRQVNPACAICGRPTQETHHDSPVRTNARRRLDPANWIPLCVSCHVTITARTRGTPVSRKRRRR